MLSPFTPKPRTADTVGAFILLGVVAVGLLALVSWAAQVREDVAATRAGMERCK